jgi:transcriptional regulator with XRE-family HTH domain
MNAIGKRLKEERLRLKMSQSALGSIGGIETNAQGNYESGLRYPRADYLSRIAQAGIDVAYVVTGLQLPATGVTAEASEPTALQPGQNANQHASHMASLIERLQGNLHGITTDLYHISRLSDAQSEAGKTNSKQTQLDNIKGEAEAIALATLRLIFVTSRLN